MPIKNPNKLPTVGRWSDICAERQARTDATLARAASVGLNPTRRGARKANNGRGSLLTEIVRLEREKEQASA